MNSWQINHSSHVQEIQYLTSLLAPEEFTIGIQEGRIGDQGEGIFLLTPQRLLFVGTAEDPWMLLEFRLSQITALTLPLHGANTGNIVAQGMTYPIAFNGPEFWTAINQHLRILHPEWGRGLLRGNTLPPAGWNDPWVDYEIDSTTSWRERVRLPQFIGGFPRWVGGLLLVFLLGLALIMDY